MEQDNALHVLIVEDDPDMASMIKMLLEQKCSATAEIVGDCASAREKFKSQTFDIITVDYQLPDGDGLELLGEIGEMDNPPPVIMVTGHGDEQTAVESFKLGASGYVVKDKRLSTLLPDAVEHALSEIRLRRAEVELRKSEEKYRFLAENATDIIWTMDMDLNWTFISSSIERVRGYTPEEAISQTLEEAHTPESFKYAMDVMAEELEADKERDPDRVRTLELEQYRKDGSTVWLSVTIRFLRDDEGNIVGILGVSGDITERRRMEEKLRQSREYYRALIENSRDVVSIINRDGTIRYISDSAEEAYGYTPEELVGTSPFEHLDPDQVEEMVNILAREINKPGVVVRVEYSYQHKDGSWHEYESICQNRIDDPAIQGIVLNSRDISERKRVEEKLKRTNVELEGYAHTVSHDLKGPLTAIMLGVDMLVDLLGGAGTGDVGETSDILATIDRNVRKAQRRTNNLLTLAESGQEPRETSRVDVRGLVDEVLEERSHEIRDKGMEVDVPGDLGAVTGSPAQLLQVFTNLIGNAIKYNDSENPVVRVSYLGDDGDGGHRYLVRDNGPGIPEDIIDDVFLPFTKGDSGDTGIGLSIVERIVKVYGGEIRAKNDNGACFEFTLRDF